MSPLSLPYHENFDSYIANQDLSCFFIFNSSKYTDTWVVKEIFIGSQPNSIATEISYPDDDDFLFLPPFRTEPNKNYFISFDHNDAAFTLYRGRELNVDSLQFFDQVNNQGGFHQYHRFFHASSYDTIYFAINSTSNNRIDDIEIGEYVCDPPYNFTHAMAGDSVTIQWESDFSDSLEIVFNAAEPIYPYENIQIIHQNSAVFHNLLGGQNYYLSVRGICATKSPWKTYIFSLPPGNDACINAINLIPYEFPDFQTSRNRIYYWCNQFRYNKLHGKSGRRCLV
ncbi:MAG: hypothetical protein IPO92_18020 [Saprospiraceae bacterium]|nr:hypothetical protein [Saprospiraceae bacterium]